MDNDGDHKAKRAKLNLPSTDEQKNLHNVDSLMRSNLLELQVKELIEQVRADKTFDKKKNSKWFDVLKDALENKKMKDMKVNGTPPRIVIGSEDDFVSHIDFAKPESLKVLGSRVLETAVSPSLNIDIGVVMPAALFDEK
jgi:hypothetical protein